MAAPAPRPEQSDLIGGECADYPERDALCGVHIEWIPGRPGEATCPRCIRIWRRELDAARDRAATGDTEAAPTLQARGDG